MNDDPRKMDLHGERGDVVEVDMMQGLGGPVISSCKDVRCH
jgi:hypothetical protein